MRVTRRIKHIQHNKINIKKSNSVFKRGARIPSNDGEVFAIYNLYKKVLKDKRCKL